MTKIQPGSIVVGTDGSAASDRAVHWATEQAALERRPLVALTIASQTPALVAAGPGAAYAVSTEGILEGARATALAATTLATRHRPGLMVEAVASVGNARTALIEVSTHAHLIVLGSHGRGPVGSKLLGSVAASVTKQAACPVVVCRPGTDLRVKNGVLVGADGTADSLPVLELAFRQASLRDQPLTVVHTCDDHAAGEHDSRLLLAESVAGFGERYPEVRVSLRSLPGSAVEALSAMADRYDLVVVGRHPIDTVLRRTLGAVATAVLERSHTNVAVVPEASTDTTH